MVFDFSTCRSLLLQGLLDAILAHTQAIASIKRIPNIEHPISAISFDILPWFPRVGFSLRTVSDADKWRFEPAAWEHTDIASNITFAGLEPATTYLEQAYSSADSPTGEAAAEIAHMMFLAGAEALLDPKVAMCLQSVDVNAPLVTDGFLRNNQCFEYFVFDGDKTIHANYCEIVIANRVAARWLRTGASG